MSVDTNNAEFQDALNLIQYTRQSVFLTGKAGTGKSTFLRYVCEHTKKKHVVLAPTGIAAINAGGSTMHSFFKLPFYPLLPDDPNLSLQRGRIHEFFKYTKPHRKLLEQIELVIIDEISMVRADIIDAIDRILRVYSHNLREPFGGKQLLLVGRFRHRRRPCRHPADHLQGGDRDRPVRRAGRAVRRRFRADPRWFRHPGGGWLRARDGLL